MTITISREPDGVYAITIDAETVILRDTLEFPLSLRLIIKNSAITFPGAEELKQLRDVAEAYFPHNPIADRVEKDVKKCRFCGNEIELFKNGDSVEWWHIKHGNPHSRYCAAMGANLLWDICAEPEGE